MEKKYLQECDMNQFFYTKKIYTFVCKQKCFNGFVS